MSYNNSRVRNRGKVPIPDSPPDDPRLVAIEKRQRDLHERNLPTTFPPEVSGSQTDLTPDLYLLMVSREAVAWGPKSLKRLAGELAEFLGIAQREAEAQIRTKARALEEQAKVGSTRK